MKRLPTNLKNKKKLIFSQHFWQESFRFNSVTDALFKRGLDIEGITGQPNYLQGKLCKGYSSKSYNSKFHNGYLVHRLPISPRTRSNHLFLVINYLSYVISVFLFPPWILRRKKFAVNLNL